MGLAETYGVPAEVMAFVDAGFLQLLSEKEEEKTVEFHIPALLYEDEEGRATSFTLIWIHPDFNAQFCHYCHENPGDLANFYVMKDTDELGDEWLDMETLDDLSLGSTRKRKSSVGVDGCAPHPSRARFFCLNCSFTGEPKMDPNVCWAGIADAVEKEQWEWACELADSLLAWVERGGFLPTITGKPAFDRIVIWQTCQAVKSWEVVV